MFHAAWTCVQGGDENEKPSESCESEDVDDACAFKAGVRDEVHKWEREQQTADGRAADVG